MTLRWCPIRLAQTEKTDSTAVRGGGVCSKQAMACMLKFLQLPSNRGATGWDGCGVGLRTPTFADTGAAETHGRAHERPCSRWGAVMG
jgi:hypothetical protein